MQDRNKVLFFGGALVEDETPRRKVLVLRIFGPHIGLKIWQLVEWIETHYPLDVLRSCCTERGVEYDFTHMWHIFTEGALLRGLLANGFSYEKRYRPVPHLKIMQRDDSKLCQFNKAK